MYSSISRMKCSYCGKDEIVTPNPNQSIDEYLNTKNVVVVEKLEDGILYLFTHAN